MSDLNSPEKALSDASLSASLPHSWSDVPFLEDITQDGTATLPPAERHRGSPPRSHASPDQEQDLQTTATNSDEDPASAELVAGIMALLNFQPGVNFPRKGLSSQACGLCGQEIPSSQQEPIRRTANKIQLRTQVWLPPHSSPSSCLCHTCPGQKGVSRALRAQQPGDLLLLHKGFVEPSSPNLKSPNFRV